MLNTKTHKLKNGISDNLTSLNSITSSLLKLSYFSSRYSLCKSVQHATCFLFFQTVIMRLILRWLQNS